MTEAATQIKTVLRIEHENGYGIFRADILGGPDLHSICFDALCRHYEMSTPHNEGLNMTDDHFCAYKSLEMMEQWIKSEEVRELLKHNFRVYLIELKEWQEGEHNVIFLKSDIVLKRDISDLFQ